MEIHLKIIGILLIILALIHIPFPKYFKWDTEQKSLSLINKQMMQTHAFFIALTVFLMGLICLTQSHLLINSPLGKTIILGLGIFWSIRLFFQLFVYSTKLWRKKPFETSMHIIFTGLWIYLSSVFFIIYFD